MENLSIQTLCDGMMRVRDNAAALLEDADSLRTNGRISRAYALAYFACEELGKLPILIGAATQISLGIPVDWKVLRKRFRSHDSKASQFMGLARAIPVIQKAAAGGEKTVDVEDLMIKAAAGVWIGPALFAKRNASIYCDFVGGTFTSPNEQIDVKMADQMIQNAKDQIAAANLIFGNSANEAAKKIVERITRERYDSIMSRAAEAADLTQVALSALRTSKRSKPETGI